MLIRALFSTQGGQTGTKLCGRPVDSKSEKPFQLEGFSCPRGDLNPHARNRALAPQASASTYSATRTMPQNSGRALSSRCRETLANDHQHVPRDPHAGVLQRFAPISFGIDSST